MSASSILDTREKVIWEGGRGEGAHRGEASKQRSRVSPGKGGRVDGIRDMAGYRLGYSRSDKTLLSSKGSGGH